MDILTIAIALFIFMMSFIIFDKYINKECLEQKMDNSIETPITEQSDKSIVKQSDDNELGDDTVKEVIYTQDYYPWWRSTRWWNYDGWLYQKPYYNYWRRPYYYNYWYAGRPLIIGGKRYYRRQYW